MKTIKFSIICGLCVFVSSTIPNLVLANNWSGDWKGFLTSSTPIECGFEEMQAAIAWLRRETDEPIVACIYTHFHYVGGTDALLNENSELPIWGHKGIETNLKRFGGEVAPRVTRGLAHQFAVMMPDDGPDGVVNVGLGNFYRNPAHAPFTNGYVPAQHTFDKKTEASIAGLDVEFYPAPSDATDSVTIIYYRRLLPSVYDCQCLTVGMLKHTKRDPPKSPSNDGTKLRRHHQAAAGDAVGAAGVGSGGV